MKKTLQWKTRLAAMLLAGGLGLTGAAQAALHDRGGGLIYDDLLDITWLQDANYAYTSGYENDGLMIWDNAVAWADSLSYYDSVRDTTWDDWRLPTVNPINGSTFNYIWADDGSTDRGYQISAPGTVYAGETGSEMAHMYNNTLGNLGFRDTSGNYQLGYGLTNTGPFYNLEYASYWSGTEYAPNTDYAWSFPMEYGYQYGIYKDDYRFGYAWAVRDGDVGAVPVPAAVWLFGSGLIGLLGVARRKRAA